MWELEQCLPGERSIVAGEYLVVDDFGWKIRKIRAASHGWGGQIWAAGDQAAGQNGVFFLLLWGWFDWTFMFKTMNQYQSVNH